MIFSQSGSDEAIVFKDEEKPIHNEIDLEHLQFVFEHLNLFLTLTLRVLSRHLLSGIDQLDVESIVA
jgi:hypothetical protein